MRQLEDPAGIALLQEARTSARHIEVRDNYHTGAETERLERFRAGEPDPDLKAWFAPWTETVTGLVSRGVAVDRLRVVTEPFTLYSRWLHSVTGFNVDAGETVRWLPRHKVTAGLIARDDWWLIDDRLLLFSLFHDGDHVEGFAVTEDPNLVQAARIGWDLLWAEGIDHSDYQPAG
ncbi:DUF6879 family protein [Nocardia testacea]|uniref:DUF6879 family protein n=1 Tax=Nocardia testacea TaxID=248551 RepID=UPI0002DB7433|nr:DUF6879 family protein [Nocardia testacea]